METKRNTDDIFYKLTNLIQVLTDDLVFTKHDKIFIQKYVVALSRFRNDLFKVIKLIFADFGEKFYLVVFRFSEKNNVHLQIPNTDPFYPLLKHSYNLLDELHQIKEHYKVYGNTEELRKLVKPTFILITDQRKLFLEEIISLMCKNYSLRIKNKNARVVISSKVKTKIDGFFKKAIEKQHHKFFELIETFARTTDSYVTMCKYLKTLKNPVDKMCKISTDEIEENTLKEGLLDHFVPGCPDVHKNVPEKTNERQRYLSEPREPNAVLNGHERSLLTIQEPNHLSSNMETQGLSYGLWLCILSFLIFFVIMIKRCLWK
ncbi:hypothetical protein NBO_604g0001 [Nosema bombycis CQ1]|uniref:Uncharacterized protein n=1 Tax=Nosema bombycis (strain CQ1 / CVCC 102059) TaxID=578461 RepID=R0M1T6_NOSB1|nr:hypothetical protein NBO_604g0001 [Nosema bombycis CQ1]|eukprot:EOB11984.1 hypothetical protein NBO_604g0001 [Nosema bombycis CQ1]